MVADIDESVTIPWTATLHSTSTLTATTVSASTPASTSTGRTLVAVREDDHQHRGAQPEVAGVVGDVGERHVGLEPGPGVGQPDDVAERRGGDAGADERRDEPSPRGPPGPQPGDQRRQTGSRRGTSRPRTGRRSTGARRRAQPSPSTGAPPPGARELDPLGSPPVWRKVRAPGRPPRAIRGPAVRGERPWGMTRGPALALAAVRRAAGRQRSQATTRREVRSSWAGSTTAGTSSGEW